MLTIAFVKRTLAMCPYVIHVEAGSMKIGTSLYDLTLADAQEEVNMCLVMVPVRYVREKIIVRHEPRCSLHTLF